MATSNIRELVVASEKLYPLVSIPLDRELFLSYSSESSFSRIKLLALSPQRFVLLFLSSARYGSVQGTGGPEDPRL